MATKNTESVVSVKEYFDARLAALDKSLLSQSESLDKRLESMNEFRLQIKDQTATFYTRQEHELFKDLVNKDLRTLQEYKTTLEAKASQISVFICGLLSFLGLVIGVIAILYKK